MVYHLLLLEMPLSRGRNIQILSVYTLTYLILFVHCTKRPRTSGEQFGFENEFFGPSPSVSSSNESLGKLNTRNCFYILKGGEKKIDWPFIVGLSCRSADE